MSKITSIEWCHHTFNPWWGCEKVSPACQHCYAETFSKRTGHGVWGAHAPRRFFGEEKWKEPLQWNAEAIADGERKRVFCASMADVFEDREDLNPWREKLWDLIDQTPMLDWLLLTKRPENIGNMVPWTTDWPENVWLGTTVENQKYADERLPHLLKHKAKVRFLSCEPLLGVVDLKKWIKPNKKKGLQGIDWIIAGGESGPGARPMNPEWVRSLRDQAQSAGVPFHFKQWGQWAPKDHLDPEITGKACKIDGTEMIRLKSKKDVDRSLDGAFWDEFPESAPAEHMEEESSPDAYGGHPIYPDGCLSAYLNMQLGWDMTLDKYHNITEISKLTNPEFPGISLRTFDFFDDDTFPLFLAKFYNQAVAYGKSIAASEGTKAGGRLR